MPKGDYKFPKTAGLHVIIHNYHHHSFAPGLRPATVATGTKPPASEVTHTASVNALIVM